MKIIYDIDCLLYFLKIKRTDLLEELFSHIVISNKVFNSLNNPSIPDFIKDKLNDLVDKEFVKVEEISYNTKTFDIYYEIKNDKKNQILGDNPNAIKDYLEKYDLRCITSEDIFNALFKKGIISKEELNHFLKK